MLQRVQKIIANSGFCSRRKAEELIASGKVSVNGKKITIGDKADEEKDTISIGSKILKFEKKVYLALNKPRGFITTSSDLYSRKKILDLIDIKERVFAVGRLDRDVAGLIFLTNDGDFANRIMHPRNRIEKTYYVELDTPLKKEERAAIEKGIRLSDGNVRGKIKTIDKKRVEISVGVGRNKIVKRIFNHFGHRVTGLCRIRIGRVALGRIKPGRYRLLTKEEIKSFQ